MAEQAHRGQSCGAKIWNLSTLLVILHEACWPPSSPPLTFSSLDIHFTSCSCPFHLTSLADFTSSFKITSQFFPLAPGSPWELISSNDFNHHFYIHDAWISRNSFVLNIKLLLPTAFWNLFHTFFKLNLSRCSLSLSPPQFCFPLSNTVIVSPTM